MPRRNAIIILGALAVLVTAALAVATNIATADLPEDWKPPRWLAWSAVIGLIVLAVVIAVAERWSAEAFGSDVTGRDAFNRRRMIEKVRSDWIDGYLRRSLLDLARIELGLEEKPDAVNRAWSLVAQQPGRASRLLPPGTSASAAFDQLGKALLILGDPGAGKTTLLLELTEVLLSRAEHDPAHPIPVVFNLATWTARERPLTAWLVDELTYRYYVPRKLARRWVDADQILPLLDGLDEVGSDRRDACVGAINTFREQHGQVPIAVCSRTGDYDALTRRLRLTGAVVIQPLPRPRVESYLERAGPALAGLRAVLRVDPALWELLETLLMLSVAVVPYRGQDATEVPPGPAREWRSRLWAAYIDAMFRRRAAASPYPQQQTVRWLAWLARMLMWNDTPVFLIERIDPVWLRTRVQRWALRYGLNFFCGLPAAVYLGFGLWLAGGPKAGLIGGLAFLLLAVLFPRHTTRPAERLRWSWAAWARGLPAAFVFAFSVSASVWGILSLIGRPEMGLVVAAYTAPIAFIVQIFIQGWQADEVLVRTAPNEGTRLSGRSGLLFGLRTAVVVVPLMLVSWFIVGLPAQSPAALLVAFTTAVVMAWTGFLLRGGAAYLQHYALRLLLWRDGVAPLNYPRFLDHAAERVLLYKVGGGYLFVHRLLMEHFAALDSGRAVPREETV
jgi:hypothetical protein